MTFKVFNHLGSSLVVQWLRFSVFTAEDAGLIPDQGTKIPEALKHRQKVINIYPSGFMHPYNCFICLSERAPLPFSFLSISLSPNPFFHKDQFTHLFIKHLGPLGFVKHEMNQANVMPLRGSQSRE